MFGLLINYGSNILQILAKVDHGSHGGLGLGGVAGSNLQSRGLMKVREIECRSAIGKCGFPGGGLAINPYVGCEHNCVYCYARFIKRFSGHREEWGAFVDARVNIAKVLARQMESAKRRGRNQTERIYVGTVTDPYQLAEKKYQLTRKILEVLVNYKNPVSILTKSDLVLRDIDLFKRFEEIDVNFTINSFDEEWKKRIEPDSPTVEARLKAIRQLRDAGIRVMVMMGPFWPEFTQVERMMKKFRELGVSRVFSESLNTIGGNWTGVEKVLKKYYPEKLQAFKEIYFNKENLEKFNREAERELLKWSKKYGMPVTIYFGSGHVAKFKKI